MTSCRTCWRIWCPSAGCCPCTLLPGCRSFCCHETPWYRSRRTAASLRKLRYPDGFHSQAATTTLAVQHPGQQWQRRRGKLQNINVNDNTWPHPVTSRHLSHDFYLSVFDGRLRLEFSREYRVEEAILTLPLTAPRSVICTLPIVSCMTRMIGGCLSPTATSITVSRYSQFMSQFPEVKKDSPYLLAVVV